MSLDIDKAVEVLRLAWPEGVAVHNYERAVRAIALFNGGVAGALQVPVPEAQPAPKAAPPNGAKAELRMPRPLSKTEQVYIELSKGIPRDAVWLSRTLGMSQPSLRNAIGSLKIWGHEVHTGKQKRSGRRAEGKRKNLLAYWIGPRRGEP